VGNLKNAYTMMHGQKNTQKNLCSCVFIQSISGRSVVNIWIYHTISGRI